jgi:3',5'-cyclic AMP phosphodiesterase CpdA
VFAAAPGGDLRAVVMHHNPVKGELSQRHGLKDTRKVLGAFAEIGVELVLCGHDHQEAVHAVGETKKGTVVSTAGNGEQPLARRAAVVGQRHLRERQRHRVTTRCGRPEARDFVPGPRALRARRRAADQRPAPGPGCAC